MNSIHAPIPVVHQVLVERFGGRVKGASQLDTNPLEEFLHGFDPKQAIPPQFHEWKLSGAVGVSQRLACSVNRDSDGEVFSNWVLRCDSPEWLFLTGRVANG